MRNGFKGIRIYHGKLLSKIIFVTIILVILFTIFLLSKFTNHLNHSLIQISTNEITRVTYRFITDKLNSSIFNHTNLEDILILEKNKQDEILYVDFNLEQAYLVLDEVSGILTDAFALLDGGDVSVAYLDEDLSHELGSMVLSIPIGNSFQNMYFYNLGPRVPVRIHFIGSVLTNLKTKVTDYGLNNALVELFVHIEFKTQIMSPFDVEEITLKYDAVIASVMIEGEVPNFYGGTIERESSIYTKEIE